MNELLRPQPVCSLYLDRTGFLFARARSFASLHFTSFIIITSSTHSMYVWYLCLSILMSSGRISWLFEIMARLFQSTPCIGLSISYGPMWILICIYWKPNKKKIPNTSSSFSVGILPRRNKFLKMSFRTETGSTRSAILLSQMWDRIDFKRFCGGDRNSWVGRDRKIVKKNA